MMVRLLYELGNGFEGIADRPTLEEARELVTPEMTDWVIFELTEPGRYAVAGKVLASSETKRPTNPMNDPYSTGYMPGPFPKIG